MKERPILFSAPMVPANGWALETPPVFGRITSPHPKNGRFGAFIRRGVGTDFPEIDLIPCPYGQPGDRLWVREGHYLHGIWSVRKADDGKRRWTFHPNQDMGVQFTEPNGFIKGRNTRVAGWYRRPSIHMPRWASRITLEITGVRVERLQDISEADAIAEGCHGPEDDVADNLPACPQCNGIGLYTAFNPGTGGALPDTDCNVCDTPVKRYRLLWEQINGPGSWDANPWVWVVDFKRVEGGAA